MRFALIVSSVALFLAAAGAPPCQAQIHKLDVAFEGVNCAPCLESMPGRAQRIRGVTSAKVDPAKGLLQLELAPANRVRVEQIRDLIQQDGTKAVNAPLVEASGTLEKQEAVWLLRIPQHALPLELKTSEALTSGALVRVSGMIRDLKRTPALLLEVTSIQRQ